MVPQLIIFKYLQLIFKQDFLTTLEGNRLYKLLAISFQHATSYSRSNHKQCWFVDVCAQLIKYVVEFQLSNTQSCTERKNSALRLGNND